EVALPRRAEAGVTRHLRAAQRSFRYMELPAIDALAVHETAARSHCDCACVIRKPVVEVVVVDDRGVVDHRVVNIDVVHEPRAAVKPRMDRFTPAQREPTDSAAEAKAHAPVRSAEESDKRRAVERTSVDRARAPTPASADERPAAIVIRR